MKAHIVDSSAELNFGQMGGQSSKLIVLLASSTNVGQDPKDVATGMKLILKEYKAQCPTSHVLLLGILPCAGDAKSDERIWGNSVNQILATYDDGQRVTYLDIGPKFLNPDSTNMSDATSNVVTSKGYEIWASAIQPVVDKYCPPAATK